MLAAPAPEAQDPTEEEREQREAEFEEALRMRVVRSDMIGRGPPLQALLVAARYLLLLFSFRHV